MAGQKRMKRDQGGSDKAASNIIEAGIRLR